MKEKKWQIAPPAPASYLATFSQYPPLIAQLLFNRGITQPSAVEQFLQGDDVDYNPFDMKGVNQAVTRLRRALRQEEPIAIYGDFDADGVTATALLVETLTALGGNVRAYIPHRVDEGYGLNLGALEKLAKAGVRLVVTVDCGIRSVKEVAYGVKQGLEIIITDHHSVGDQLPPALTAINPKQPDCPYPFKELAGVGIAFKLAQALLRSHQRVPITSQAVRLVEEDLLDLVALGTVADLVPLLDENRALVQKGLVKLNEPQRPGVLSLVQQSGLKLGKIDAEAISYGLGPRVNAAGRLAHAGTAYELLVTRYPGEADQLATELNRLNQQRQQVTRETQAEAMEKALADGDVPLLFAASPNFIEGVVGLAAGRLAEEFYRPSVVARIGKTSCRGSARSIPEFHITKALDQCADLLVRYGGHAAAAGFTVSRKNLTPLANRLKRLAEKALAGQTLQPVVAIDAEVNLGQLNRHFYNWLIRLAPFGYANPPPLFASRRLRVVRARTVGVHQNHLKLYLSDGRITWDAIAFRQGDWFARLPTWIDVAYHFELNEWNNQERFQLNVQDIRASQ